MMSWIRTAVSLIGFGFTIVQFFERLQDIPGVNPALHPAAPRYLGLALIGCGVVGPRDLRLAVPLDNSLPVERKLRAACRNDR